MNATFALRDGVTCWAVTPLAPIAILFAVAVFAPPLFWTFVYHGGRAMVCLRRLGEEYGKIHAEEQMSSWRDVVFGEGDGEIENTRWSTTVVPSISAALEPLAMRALMTSCVVAASAYAVACFANPVVWSFVWIEAMALELVAITSWRKMPHYACTFVYSALSAVTIIALASMFVAAPASVAIITLASIFGVFFFTFPTLSVALIRRLQSTKARINAVNAVETIFPIVEYGGAALVVATCFLIHQ